LVTWHRLASALVRPRMVANRFDHLAIVEPESVGAESDRSRTSDVKVTTPSELQPEYRRLMWWLYTWNGHWATRPVVPKVN
jgi:hypothetical protein